MFFVVPANAGMTIEIKIMSRFFAFIYGPMIAKTEAACLQDWRKELLANAYGKVLEVGAGTGANIYFYPQQVQELIISEPDEFMRKRLLENLENSSLKNTQIKTFGMENIDLDDNSVDCVVSTLVCCSVTSPHEALKQGKRQPNHPL